MDGEESAEDSSAMKNALVAAFVLPREDDGSGNGSYSQEALGEEVPFKSLLNALHDLCQTRFVFPFCLYDCFVVVGTTSVNQDEGLKCVRGVFVYVFFQNRHAVLNERIRNPV